ncbi:OmpA/MotB family protein [Desulfovibrio litoralis]|uniref:Chemotaxis protein MotB n=1 Tax=Desulfovibrio litoralis DSM 11393 TaxID=1121455 RepID=A0A1M7RUI8_9BACT|nr:flagellar motor protein MotB [Desulfovibrio litoralis]SHN49935.1 chemotaxis protein MotB [Desulfovibrio litoralis DSM 11393]
MGGGSWKVAYADFVTAMMAFFLLMWILNMVPPETKQILAQYFTADYKLSDEQGRAPMPGEGVSPISSLTIGGDKADAENLQAISNELQKSLLLAEEADAQKSVGLTRSDAGVLLRVAGDVMFKPNSVVFSQAGMQVLDEVAKILKNRNIYVVVRGHADSSETGLPYFPSRWELSAARATVAVRYLVDKGVDPSRVRSVAYADTVPLVPSFGPNDPASAKNRRVEFYFHKPDSLSLTLGY